MSEPRRNQREQEISIKEREGELFRREDQIGPVTVAKSFAEYLRETPATPPPSWVKVALWVVGAVVALLFAAALWRLQSKPPPRNARSGRPRTTSSTRARPPAPPLSMNHRPLPLPATVADASRPTSTNPEKS